MQRPYSVALSTLALLILGACTTDTGTTDTGGSDISDTGTTDTGTTDTGTTDTGTTDTGTTDTGTTDTGTTDTDTGTTDTGTTDTGTTDTGTTDAGGSELPVWIADCNSLFALRVAELAGVTDCTVPLLAPVGRLRGTSGDALCVAGESPNTCRDRLYATPPAVADLDPACGTNPNNPSCLRGTFLARCADGSNSCAEDEAVCVDGTRPMIYARAATSGGPSTVWWFHLGGEGGPCNGSACWLDYRLGDNAFRQAMSTLYPGAPASGFDNPGGVMSGEAALPYASVNRVRFERCTDAASDATEVIMAPNGVPSELADRYPGAPVATTASAVQVWYRGLATWRSAFHTMTTVDGRDLDGDGTPDMPSLADATTIVLSGSSDASLWVVMAADRLAEELRAIAGADVDVRIAVDGNFPAMLDNEGRYHPDAPADFNVFANPYHVTGLCGLPDNGDGIANEACSDATYREGGAAHDSYSVRGVFLDASCQRTHGDGAAECFDRNHVMLHHLSTPVLILADQEDVTISSNPVAYTDVPGYVFRDIAQFRERVLDQGWDIVDHWGTAAREEGAGNAGDFIVILPKTRRDSQPPGRATHVRFANDDAMAEAMTLCAADGTRVTTASYNAMLGAWLAGNLPQTFAIEDSRRTLPNGSFWVTGANCRSPE